MIHPTDQQLLGGIATALKDTVLPELARGSAARKQLQAAIETLRRMAFAAPGRAAALEADNADMAEVLRQVEEILTRRHHLLTESASPLEGEVGAQRRVGGEGAAFYRQSEYGASTPPPAAKAPPTSPSRGEAHNEIENDLTATHQTLQQTLTDLQATIPPELAPEITAVLTQLYARMTDRALALIPPPMPRSPRKPE
jgi:hypothetical protein